MTPQERGEMREKFEKEGLIDPIALDNYFKFDRPDPLLLALAQQCAERDRKQQAEGANSQTAGA
jgi:hypothetical protein